MNVQSKIESFTCPCCGGFMGEAAPIQSLIEAETSWVAKAILEVLSKPVGRRMRRDAIIEAIYQFEEEPDDASNNFRVVLSRLRKRLLASGWTIVTEPSKGPFMASGALYRLIPTEVNQ